MRGLVTAFNRIRATYFPHWNKKQEWTIKIKDTKRGYCRGFCDSENKEICINPSFVPKDNTDLLQLIIHEICHAVGFPDHGKQFQARFLKAANRAQLVGEVELSDRIREEIRLLQESLAPSYRARNIYNSIQDAVLDQPDASLDAILTWVAGNYALTLHELLKRYRKAEKVFMETKEWVAREKAVELKVELLKEVQNER